MIGPWEGDHHYIRQAHQWRMTQIFGDKWRTQLESSPWKFYRIRPMWWWWKRWYLLVVDRRVDFPCNTSHLKHHSPGEICFFCWSESWFAHCFLGDSNFSKNAIMAVFQTKSASFVTWVTFLEIWTWSSVALERWQEVVTRHATKVYQAQRWSWTNMLWILIWPDALLNRLDMCVWIIYDNLI